MDDAGLSFREATMEDADFLFRCANDPVARKASFSTSPIAYNDHLQWLGKKLGSKEDYKILVFADHGVPVGVGRAERRDYGVEIGVAVAPEKRGMKYGVRLLRMLNEYCFNMWENERLFAHIKEDNPASLKIFSAAGYVDKGKKVFKNHLCREFVAAPGGRQKE